MSRVLAVVGGTGFIGRAVADAAQTSGYEPVLLAPDAPSGATVHAADAPLLHCDVTDPASVAGAFAELRPAAVCTLAAFGSGPRGLLAGADADPRKALAVNVQGFVNVVHAAGDAAVRRVVWASSTTVYGPAERYRAEPVDEHVPLGPTTVYGATKAAAELLSESLEARTGVRAVALRLPLVYGPGRWYGGSQDDLVAFVDDVAAGRPARLAATDAVADWIYVADAAAAFLLALAAPDPARAYNVTGHRSSLADVGRALAAHAWGPADVAPSPAPASGLRLPLVDDGAARRDLGFRPSFDLDRAAADYIARTEHADAHPS